MKITATLMLSKISMTAHSPERPSASWMSVAEAVRAIGVTEVTYYRWRQEFGGLKSGQAKCMKDLGAENTRLRRAISGVTLDKIILAEAVTGTEDPC